MSYFADSAWNYLAQKLKRLPATPPNGQRLLVTLPALPENVMLDVAETFTSRCSAINEVDLTLKIAQAVSNNWSPAGKRKAEFHGWLDDCGNLTCYRNQPGKPGKNSLIILCGTDRIMDAGSLADFNHCGLDTVWKEEMRESFQGWVKVKLDSVGIEMTPSDLKGFDRVLVPLLESARGSLTEIGVWLEKLDLTGTDSASDMQRVMLGALDEFRLPNLTGFSVNRKGAALAPYLDKANVFFSYAMFLEEKERKKAINAIDKILACIANDEETGLPLDNPELLGPYADGTAVLQGLKNYIQDENEEDRERLFKCDFVTIMDRVLKFRKAETAEKKETLRKISGSPVEMVLSAVWQTLQEFSREKSLTEAEVQRIEIVGDRFKHDAESVAESEDDSALEQRERARCYLRRLLGGVDGLVKGRMDLLGAGGEKVPVECRLLSDTIDSQYSMTTA